MADSIWRDRIASELLQEKISNAPAESGPEAVGRHYRELQNAVDHQDDQQLLGIFLEAVAQTYDLTERLPRHSAFDDYVSFGGKA